MHYMLFESENDPEKDPLIVWLNGGPGASSMFGAFTELGPYLLSAASLQTREYEETHIPTLLDNPRSWTTLASLVVLNSPPPVGFSYCSAGGPSGDGYSCGNWTDERTVKVNTAFIYGLLEKYPRYKTNAGGMVMVGESYGGIYVPMLADEIAKGPFANQLKGIGIGDGCIGNAPCVCTKTCGRLFDIQFFYGHGQVSHSTYESIFSNCTMNELRDGNETADCKEVIQRVFEEVGGFYGYNLYDECEDFELWRYAPGRKKPPSSGGYPCGGSRALRLWVNTSSVKENLHVDPSAFFFLSDDGNDFNYAFTRDDTVGLMKTLAESGRRVLVYDGDSDPALNSFHAQNWTEGVGFPVRESWRAWTIDGTQHAAAGHVVRYEHNFDFVTIRGAGHMVPTYKPDAAYTMIKSWLQNKDYPRTRTIPDNSSFLGSPSPREIILL